MNNINAIGRISTDLKLKESKGKTYINFILAVQRIERVKAQIKRAILEDLHGEKEDYFLWNVPNKRNVTERKKAAFKKIYIRFI